MVEDSPGDVRLAKEFFRDADVAIQLHVAEDGIEAMDFLLREGAHTAAPRPDLILLDLNLPRMDGREVLANIKQNETLKNIPTIILTTSEAEEDILKSYQLHANCYVSKPVQLEAFESVMQNISDFWLTKIRFPGLLSRKVSAHEENYWRNVMPVEILMVEDSPGDVRLTRELFQDADVAVKLHVAEDGVEAMAFLRQEGVHANAPRPDLILLDLNLPRMDGREVLANIKQNESLKTIPTIILTTSEAEADIIKSYQLQANCYLSKPVQLDAFEGIVRSISDFWLTKVKFPSRGKSDEKWIE
nr:response regulator [Granulicella sp. dw_53]